MEHTVAHRERSLRSVGYGTTVGHRQDGRLHVSDGLIDEVEDDRGRFLVELAGRFIGQ
jgi:hypothetical protein